MFSFEMELFRSKVCYCSYDLKCRLCGAFICKSTSMRVACDSQYVCCDPTIWERIDARVYSAKVSLFDKSFKLTKGWGFFHNRSS